MALHLNLLHEEILEQRQRQRDPLKIGLMILVGMGALLFLFYSWNAYRTLAIKNQLSVVERDWAKVEPKVTAAQKRTNELNVMIKTTAALDDYIEHRFFWAPLLARVARCVAPNTQLTSLEGVVADDNKSITVVIDGVAAGREPRSAAEDLRQMLGEQLAGAGYNNVKVEFKALEDLDTMVKVGGTNMMMAHYVLNVSFEQPTAASPKETPRPGRSRKK